MKDKTGIPKDILPYFLEIAKQLWSGHATIMIGAGFSKNARKSESTQKSFPDWDELGDIFYEKMHGVFPTDKRYLNSLKLADEVQAAFGRNTLNQILRAEIPDKEYQPSLLHEKLLQLPWTDVFTTNYDTLLERTAERILQHRYETVINKEDLILSTKPRIIKLHGSFPSERPFIITEEDYRQYPKEFAPFVNTVQQSLLENTLCLIGFSGDDPNFLKWIGWIRDNLGKENSPKIFLLGILSLTVGQKRLLEDRNIIPVNLSDCEDIDKDHEKALTLFIDFLHEQGKKEENLNWPDENKHPYFNCDQDIAPQIIPIIENWTSTRLKYPNWLILPEDRRETLKSNTDSCIPFIYHLSKVEHPKDIEFLYEINWRIEKCLSPIENNLIEHYEKVINSYNPFPKQLELENAIYPDSKKNSKIDWKVITIKWEELQLSMLRLYREEGFHEKWELVTNRFSKIIEGFTPEIKARYFYERCLYFLFKLDISSVRKELDSWPTDISLPYWEAKRAGLYAELGDASEAERILEISLKTVRGRLNLSPITNDYSNVSQEAYIMQLLRYVKYSVSIFQRTFTFPDSVSKDYTERWNILIQYKCDPWAELRSFEIYLENEPIISKQTEKKYGFDIGRVSITHKFGRNDKYAEKAYSFLRYIEEIGCPFRLPGLTLFSNEIAQKAITHIANYSPYWAFASYVRLGDSKFIDSIFGRKYLSKIDKESVDKLINEYLSVLESSIIEIKNGDAFWNKNFAISLSTIIPEILSRLCVKSSYEIKLKLLGFLKNVFRFELRDKYNGIKSLTNRLINSFSGSEQYEIIPVLLDFPILPELNRFNEGEFIDPFEFINIDKNNIKKKVKIEPEKIDELFTIGTRTSKERRVAISRLVKLLGLGCLSAFYVDKLGELLWSRIDEATGFPKETNFYNFAFINLPHPKNINPEKLLKDYISGSKFPIQTNKQEQGVSMTYGDIKIFHEINGTSYSDINFIWSEEEIGLLVNNVIEWWDADKKYINNEDSVPLFGSVANEFKARFSHLNSILVNILSPNYKLIDEKEEVIRILNELENFNMPYIEVKASFYLLLPEQQNKIFLTIYKGLFSRSNSEVLDALRGFLKLLEFSKENLTELLQFISENIRGLNDIALDGFLNVITLVIKNYPESINSKILNDLEIGLTNLIQETVILSDDSDEIVNNKILYRMKAAHLTVSLYAYFKSKNKKIPDYIKQWKNLCLDPNEFSEIRNIWEDR